MESHSERQVSLLSLRPATHTVCRTILLSVISLLNEPNTFSAANVDASVMYRRWKESKGKDKEYESVIRSVSQ